MGRTSPLSRRDFVASVGAFGVATLTAGTYGCSSNSTIPATLEGTSTATYRSAAQAGFTVLTAQYKTPHIFEGNFWFGGTTLHTCLDYLLAARETDQHTQILPAAFKIYQSLTNSFDGWWKDDYGWWGVAFSIAVKHRQQLGYGDSSHDELFGELRNAAESCWDQLESNWRDTTYNRKVKGGYSDNAAGSADIRGGTFNNSPDSTNPPMTGRNSVTNEGFWILSQLLAQLIPGNPKYSRMAAAESAWFEKWLAFSGSNPGSTGILNGLGLVLERPTGNRTDPAWFWSGDQGLFIRALPAGSQLAHSIAKTVISNMTDDQNILHDNLQYLKFKDLQTFEADYATGKGIFMRNLLPLVFARPAQYSSFVKANATAVWCNRSSANQFTYNWNPADVAGEPKILRVSGKSDQLCDLIMQAAGQEALNAAVSIAAGEKIACS
jgi:hypothetical protein